ncbi:MAG: FAD-dependent oxidoreductase, partial [Methylobacteriaceae bacterium]|jgi:glycerol-3-phosphate dehydrogenase|nr:FAD-dependent oxidoreductase [Methylobacteriaceae bacterium]
VLDAVTNGAAYLPDWRAAAFTRGDNGWRVLNDRGEALSARFVINCAGLQGDIVDAAAGYHDFTIKPRKGQFLVFDKLAAPLVKTIIVPPPSSAGRGVLVIPTIFGNVMLGPTAEEVSGPFERSVTKETMDALMAAGRRIIPELENYPLVTAYAGVRPATENSEYRIIPRLDDHWITVGGIRSTGLSASLGIAAHVTQLLGEALDLIPKDIIHPVRAPDLSAGRAPPWLENPESADDREMVCHCEKITLGDVKRALAAPLPAATPAALKRRTRAGMGRCQGFFCGARLDALLAAGKGERR